MYVWYTEYECGDDILEVVMWRGVGTPVTQKGKSVADIGDVWKLLD